MPSRFRTAATTLLLLAIACAGLPALVGCENRRSGDASVSIADAKMDAAIARGKATLSQFLRVFDDPQPGWTGFQVRLAYTTDSGYPDAIWLDLLSMNEDARLVTRVPEDEEERAARFPPGSEVIDDQIDVTDWMFIDESGTFVGGYTLRVTMDRIGNTSDDRDEIHGGIPFRDLDPPETPAG